MSKHTPGPWRLAHMSDQISDEVLNIEPASGAEYIIAQVFGDVPELRPALDANAALIAAAPEMLEALEAIMAERWSPAGRSEHVSDMARAVLAKARGS